MTLKELQDVLGERINIIINEDVPMERRQEEKELSQTIASLAKQMINNADVVLRAEKLISEGKLIGSAIEKMIK